MNGSRQSTFGSGIGQHLLGNLAGLLQQVFRHRHELRAVAGNSSQGLRLQHLRLGQRTGMFGQTGVVDHGLQIGRQDLPNGLRHQQFRRAIGLVETRHQDIGGNARQAEIGVIHRPQQFHRINGAALQSRIDITGRDRLRHGPQTAVDLAAKPRHP